jgi:FkbM family methyltransferase
MSKKIAGVLARMATAATTPMKPYRQRITRALVCERMAQTVSVSYNGIDIRFHATTARALHDVLSLGRGEPETVRWIDSLEPGVLWDVGANVGVYSLYAAARGHRVVAFEPAAATYAALCKNIELNGIADRIAAYCMALGDRTHAGTLWMTSSDAGHSMHSIADSADRSCRQSTAVFRAAEISRMLDLPPPDYVKIDVDGIEAALVGEIGAFDTLRSIIVEALTFEDQTAITAAAWPHRFHKNDALSDGHARNLVFERQVAPAPARPRLPA